MNLQTIGQLSGEENIIIGNVRTTPSDGECHSPVIYLVLEFQYIKFYKPYFYTVITITSLSNVGETSLNQSEISSTGLQQLGATSPVNALAPLAFTGTMLPPTTSAQERQVVNELQSILEQSVQQNQHDKVVADMMSATTIMSIKPENTFSNVLASIQENVNLNVPASVPLDLQFPTDTIQSGTSVIPVAFPEQEIGNPPFSSAPVISCINPEGISQLMTRSVNLETNADPKLLTGLLSDPQTSIASSNSFVIPAALSSIPMNSVNSDSMTLAEVVTASQLRDVDCRGQVLIKAEPQLPLATNVCMAINNSIVSSQPTPTIASNGTINPTNFIGELQPHQGTFANALTQLSDNELMNYINPSCFEQNLI